MVQIGIELQNVEVGREVWYYSYIDGDKHSEPMKTVIRSEAWRLGHGELVCKIKGVSGGVSLRHLSFVYYPEIK